MSDHHLHTLFSSDVVCIEDYRCNGRERNHEEESAFRHEIVFPRRGAFLRRDASGEVLSDCNHILFFHAHQPYEIEHPIAGGDCSTVFALQSEALMDMLREVDCSVDDRPHQPFRVSHSIGDARHHLLQYRILNMIHSADALAIEEMTLHLLGQIVNCVYTQADYPAKKGRNTTLKNYRDIVNQVKLVLAGRFCEPLQLSDIARAVYSSPYALCRIFKKETGLSLHQYLQRLRLLHALEQLAENPQSDLTNLALEIGFSSHSHFTTAFSSLFGIPPSTFRASRPGEMSKILKA